MSGSGYAPVERAARDTRAVPFVRAGARRGVAAAQVPEAVAAARAVLDAGGNAYDAVLAAAFVETVALPPKCGLAGDVVALVVDTAAGTAETLVAIGPAPAGLVPPDGGPNGPPAAATSGAGVAAASGREVVGGRAVGVPGAPAGYGALAARASVGVGDLVVPAARLARDGVTVGPVLARLTRASAPLLRRFQPGGCAYLPAGRPPAVGEVVRWPGLADLLEAFAADGAALFHGHIGASVVQTVSAHGGVLTRDDLRTPVAVWAPAAWRRVGEVELAVTPGPTYGPLLTDALTELAAGADSVDAVTRAEGRRGILAADGGTSVAAAAVDGTAVVLVHSNSFPEYGAGLVVPELDLVLNNRPGRGFGAGPSRLGERPPTTLHAWALRTREGAVVAGATPGGENQPVWNTQLLSGLVAGTAGGSSTPAAVAAALAAPRWARQPDGTLAAEAGWAGAVPAARTDAVTSSHVVAGHDAGGWWAAADPRQTATVS